MHKQVLSIAPPTECSLAVTLPSAQLSNKGGSQDMPVGFDNKCQGPSWIFGPPSEWNTWEEYLQSKPGEFTPDKIVADCMEQAEDRQDCG